MQKTNGTHGKLDGLVKATALMSSPVMQVSLQDSIHDVAKMFVDNNIGCALVVNSAEAPMGVITKTDISKYDQGKVPFVIEEQRAVPRSLRTKEPIEKRGIHLELEEETVEHWMTPALFDVGPDDTLAKISKKMVKYGTHHIFVTNPKSKQVLGVITSFDVLQFVARSLNGG